MPRVTGSIDIDTDTSSINISPRTASPPMDDEVLPTGNSITTDSPHRPVCTYADIVRKKTNDPLPTTTNTPEYFSCGVDMPRIPRFIHIDPHSTSVDVFPRTASPPIDPDL
jgi:hypothetical protein